MHLSKPENTSANLGRVDQKKAIFENKDRNSGATSISRSVDVGAAAPVIRNQEKVIEDGELAKRHIALSNEATGAFIVNARENQGSSSECSTVNDESGFDTSQLGPHTMQLIRELKDTEEARNLDYRGFNNDCRESQINILRDNLERIRITNNYLRKMVAVLVSVNAASFLGETVPFELKMAIGVVIYVILNKFLEPLFFGLLTLFKKVVDSIVLLSAKIADTERFLLGLMMKSIKLILAISVLFAPILHHFNPELGIAQLRDTVIELIRTNQLDKAAQDVIENSYTQYGACILLILSGMGAVNIVCNTVMNWFISRLQV